MKNPSVKIFIIIFVLLFLSALLMYSTWTTHNPQLKISAEQAVALALNDLVATNKGFSLHHPNHTAEFTREGFTFTPKGGEPAWHWQLTYLGTVQQSLANVSTGAIFPQSQDLRKVTYLRGAVIEQYIFHQATIEQQFILLQPLTLAGQDLMILGQVASAGTFEASYHGWAWRTSEGMVNLGGVTVYDAQGTVLPAEMTVTAQGTRILVDGAALAQAVYPVVIDPEVGTNDFRISDMGPEGDTNYVATRPAVAYNSVDHEYLVVWYADDNTGGVVDNEYEIFGQRIDATTGDEVGTNDFRISTMGGSGNANYGASSPAVAYNLTNNEFLVVWSGDDNINGLVEGEYEIFGQRLFGATGGQVGSDDFRISSMGPNGDINHDAFAPAIAYNVTNNEYLVVWEGNNGPDFDIYGQRLDAETGLEAGSGFRISTMGPSGDTNYAGTSPDVAYNATENEYLVVWDGDDDVVGIDNENEIFGQRLDAATGGGLGINDFRISDMGPGADTNYDAYSPAVAYNATDNEYLVVWYGDDITPPLVEGEYEIFGQRLDSAGAELGDNDFRISEMGPDGNISYDAFDPDVAYQPNLNEYLVVWSGGLNDLVNHYEIYGQRLNATGSEIGENDYLLSDTGTDENDAFSAYYPALDANPLADEYLIAWYGYDILTGTPEREIYGQRFQIPSPTPTVSVPTPTSTPTPEPGPSSVYLPLVLRPPACLANPNEQEPNNSPETATGPLCLNQNYFGTPANSNFDFFSFILDTTKTITIDLTNHPLASMNGAQLQLYYESYTLGNKKGEDTLAPYQIVYPALPGTYYILIYNDTSKCELADCLLNYTLRISD